MRLFQGASSQRWTGAPGYDLDLVVPLDGKRPR